MQYVFTFLGTSTSVGVPVIGCDCNTCQSDHPHDQRMRSSAHILAGEISLLIDAGPDLRQQALRHGLNKVDHMLYTHQHLDHIAGFDELRAFCWRREDRLPLYGNRACLEELERIYHWAFSDNNKYKGYIRPRSIVVENTFQLDDLVGLDITPLPVRHASVETIGYRFDTPHGSSLAYIPDVKEIPKATFSLLEGVEILIIDCLREEPHGTHMSLSESLEVIERINPKQAYLTHISHEMDRERVCSKLPKNVTMAYDTLQFTF